MSFRKNSILFYENIILLAALSLLMIAVGLVTNFPILCLCAVPLLIVALVSPKLDREYITIDEWGISCKEGDRMTSCRSTSTALLRSSAVTMKAWVNERNPALCSRKGRFGIIHGQRLFRGPAQLEIVPVRSKWLRLAGRIVGDHLDGGKAKPGASPQIGDMRPIEAPA